MFLYYQNLGFVYNDVCFLSLVQENPPQFVTELGLLLVSLVMMLSRLAT